MPHHDDYTLRHGKLETVADVLSIHNVQSHELQLVIENLLEQIIMLKLELEEAQCKISSLEGVVQP